MDADLLADLTDADEETRAVAYEELALEMDDEIAHALLDIAAGDAAEEIRSDAIAALGPVLEECSTDYDEELGFEWAPELGPPVSRQTFASIVSRIEALYSDEAQPKLIRRRAFEVLIRDPRPWHADAIRRHFASEDAEWKLTAVFAMGYIPGFGREIVEVLDKEKEPLLYEAVRAAGTMDVLGAAARIRALAASRDTDHDVRVEAILALPNVDPDCFDLLDDLARSRDREVKEAAEIALDELAMHQEAEDLEDDEFDEE